MLPPLILDKVKINIVQVMDQFPIGYQLSACPLVSMIKLETADNPVYNVLCFFFFFCFSFFFVVVFFFLETFFVCFLDSFNTTKPFRL